MSNSYDEPRAHQLREAYHAVFGGDELPVPVESIAEIMESDSIAVPEYA